MRPGKPRTIDDERVAECIEMTWHTKLNGAVLASCKPRRRHQRLLDFLHEVDEAVPGALDAHCIVDNHATHSHPKTKAWLMAWPRWHMHFIPTYTTPIANCQLPIAQMDCRR